MKNMAIESIPTDIHWNYFLSLESDLLSLSRFIEFDEKNYECFSIENVRILMAAAAEVDVVCKQICQRIDLTSKANNINKYRDVILQVYQAIPQHKITIPRFGLKLTPWENWQSNDGVPFWWTAYNKVKHHRHTSYDHANLKNTINAVAGLFVMCLYLYEDVESSCKTIGRTKLLKPSPSLLTAHIGSRSSFDMDGKEYTLFKAPFSW